MTNLIHRAVEIYRQEGIVSLSESMYNFSLNSIYWSRRHRAPDYILIDYMESGVLGTMLSIFDHFLSLLILSISIDREGLIDLSERNQKIWWLAEGDILNIESSKTKGELPHSFKQVLGEWETPDMFVCEIEDATILGPRGILTVDGRPILEAFVNSPASFLIHLRGTLVELGRNETLFSTLGQIFLKNSADSSHQFDVAVSLLTRHPTGKGSTSPSYSHWVQEDLTKLWAVEKYYEKTGQKPTLLINSDPPSWMTETLKLVGYDESDWVEWDGDIGRINKLVVPRSTPTGSFSPDPSPQAQQWLRNTILDNIKFDDMRDFSKYVYKSRQGAPKRRVSNFEEVTEILSDNGFESYRAEDLSIAENIKLCSQAEVIISPVGTGLTDMLFADDPTIVEIFHDQWIPNFNFLHSNVYGFDYYYILGDARDTEVEFKNSQLVDEKRPDMMNIYVDPDEFRCVLETIID